MDSTRAPSWAPPLPGTPARTIASEPTVVIEAQPQTIYARLTALWRYRNFYGFLFKELTIRKARGTLLGLWWLLIRPLIPAAAIIFTFAVVHPLDSGSNIPYPVFFLSGYIPWRLFQSSVMFLPRTLLWMQGIMRRTYFPRLLVPLAGFGTPLIEFAVLIVAFAILLGVSYSGGGSTFPLRFGWETLWLLPCLVASLIFALALGMVLSVVALFFRDIVFTVSYVAQLFMFLTPVVYPVTFVPESYRWVLYALNPMAQIVEVSRWALTGTGQFDAPFLALSFGTILASLIASVAFFLRAEAHLADQM